MVNTGRIVLLMAVGLPAFGCGGGVGEVKGTVTLDGKPLPGAFVTFQPEDGSRPSVARTDDSGSYELKRTEKVKGAAVGKHKVRITTGGEADEVGKKSNIVPEKVPTKYNSKTELVKDVQPGPNEINLALDSKGEVIPVGKEPSSPKKGNASGCGGEEEPAPDELTGS